MTSNNLPSSADQADGGASPERRSLGRRAVVRGAAWSVPVVVVAASPAMAQNGSPDPCVPTPVTFQATVPSTATSSPTNGPATTQQHLIPEGVTEIQFEVLGGAGGYGSFNDIDPGTAGSGALLKGTLTVAPGTLLTLIAGNGGAGPSNYNQGVRTGGGGYGNGGNTGAPTAINGHTLTGGSGGGGSAILLGTTPLVVAGGGGGVGAFVGVPVSGWTIPRTGSAHTSNGGTLDGDRGDDNYVTRSANSVRDLLNSGGGAVGATPGQPRGTTSDNQADPDNRVRRYNGNAGTGPGAAGGNGGVGETGQAYYSGATYGWLQMGSGGGGGGYAGGASGAIVQRLYNYDTASVNPYTYVAGGSGGGGSSYIDSTAVASYTAVAGNNGPGTGDGRRHPGYVKISYVIPCPPEA